MRDAKALDAAASQLLVVDFQERLVPAMPAPALRVALASLRLLAAAADGLGVPVTITEHVPTTVGATVADVLTALPQATILAKVHFGAANEPHVLGHLEQLGRPRVVICGMETHVCVLQTALGLAARGFRVVLVPDASCSRHPADEALAVARSRDHGIEVASAEMVAFEWLHRADHPARRRVIEAVKAASRVRAEAGAA